MSPDDRITITLTRFEADMLRKTSDKTGQKMRAQLTRPMHDAWRSAIRKIREATKPEAEGGNE